MINLETLIDLLDQKTKIEQSIKEFSRNNKLKILKEFASDTACILGTVDFECLVITCKYPYAFYNDSTGPISNKQDVEIDWDETSDQLTEEISDDDFDYKSDQILELLDTSFLDMLPYILSDSILTIKKDGSYEVLDAPTNFY